MTQKKKRNNLKNMSNDDQQREKKTVGRENEGERDVPAGKNAAGENRRKMCIWKEIKWKECK